MLPTEHHPRPRLDARLRVSLVAVALTGAAFALVTLPLFGIFAAFSVAVGAGLATGNLWALARIVAALLPDGENAEPKNAGPKNTGPKNTGPWVLVGLLKMFGLIAVVWLLMRQGLVSVLPMVVGFGALPIGIAIGALVSDRGASRPPTRP
jgi:hypothetical protein